MMPLCLMSAAIVPQRILLEAMAEIAEFGLQLHLGLLMRVYWLGIHLCWCSRLSLGGAEHD
jgi:hypothetical protein